MSSSSSSSSTSPYAREQKIAIAAVLKASLLAQKIQQELVGSGGLQKKDKSPVTGQSQVPGALSLLALGRPRDKGLAIIGATAGLGWEAWG